MPWTIPKHYFSKNNFKGESFMKMIHFLLALLITTQGWGTAHERKVTETRDVAEFTKIHLMGKANLIIQQGDEESVKIVANGSLIPYIRTKVKKGTLKIDEKVSGWESLFKVFETYDVYVTVKEIEEINLAGKGKVLSESTLRGNSLALSISGAGDMNLALNVKKLSASLAGSGQYYLNGKTEVQEITVTGKGDYNALEMASDRAAVDIRGFADIEINVKEKLDVSITGKGTVRYIGKPVVSQKIFGSGKIQELE